MKNFIQSKLFGSKKAKQPAEQPSDTPEQPAEEQAEINGENPVVCMDCGNRTKLFYDLAAGVADEGDEEQLEGYDLESKDPIRCILCRKFSKYRDNEPIQCEDCQTNATIFYWKGKYNDVIL